jgi:hypothetical protein
MEENKDSDTLDQVIDSLLNCFDGGGYFGLHSNDANRAGQAYTTAVGKLGMTPEQFIDLVVGEAQVRFKNDETIQMQVRQSIKDFVDERLRD